MILSRSHTLISDTWVWLGESSNFYPVAGSPSTISLIYFQNVVTVRILYIQEIPYALNINKSTRLKMPSHFRTTITWLSSLETVRFFGHRKLTGHLACSSLSWTILKRWINIKQIYLQMALKRINKVWHSYEMFEWRDKMRLINPLLGSFDVYANK